jgi:hypothetical protein
VFHAHPRSGQIVWLDGDTHDCSLIAGKAASLISDIHLFRARTIISLRC